MKASKELSRSADIVQNSINSIEEEIKFLSAYIHEFHEMSRKVVGEYADYVDSKLAAANREFEIGTSMFSDLQDYLLLANPEVTIICERYNQFRLIRESYESIKKDDNLKKTPELSERREYVETQIKNHGKYFKQFKELYDKHIENWQLLVDINTTEQKYGAWALFTSGMELYQDKVQLVLSPRLFLLLEKMEKNLISLEDLRKSSDYSEIKDFIANVRTHKEFLMNRVAEVLRTSYAEINEKKKSKLSGVHRVYINMINDLYEKKYANVPIQHNMQSSLLELEDNVKFLRHRLNEMKSCCE